MFKTEHLSISDFYKEKNVFVTGATGFLGKMLIMKLLQECADIGNIYLLIRPKKGKDVNERVEDILKDLLFDKLKQTAAHQLSKLIPIRGDCAELNLGLSETNYKLLTSSVSVIYHVAASIRFDDPLKHAILLNTRSTREVAQLALQTPGLSVLVHVSTTYCNCVHGRDIKEQIYPAPDDWRKAIKMAEEFNSDQIALLTNKYLGPYPNTYTFAKALGEHVIMDLCEGKIPTVICRPSIVLSTIKDPVPGWIDNFNGPMGTLIACGKGLLRCGYFDTTVNSDYIPVDVVVKAMIVASWDSGLRQQTKNIDVIQCSSSTFNWISTEKMVTYGRQMSVEVPLNNSIWVPKGGLTSCIFYAYICWILFHLVPAFFLDLCLKLAGKKPMLMKLQTRIYHISFQLRYFTWQEWNFCNNKFYELNEKILEKDRNAWGYDFRDVDTKEYVKNCLFGTRKYLLHETEETLPAARIHYNRMYWLDKITMLILYGSLFWIVLHFQVPQKIVNTIYNTAAYYFNGE